MSALIELARELNVERGALAQILGTSLRTLQRRTEERAESRLARIRGNRQGIPLAGTACVLRVPSVIVPDAYNLLVNPLHPDALSLRLVHSRDFAFDGRFL